MCQNAVFSFQTGHGVVMVQYGQNLYYTVKGKIWSKQEKGSAFFTYLQVRKRNLWSQLCFCFFTPFLCAFPFNKAPACMFAVQVFALCNI